MPLIVGNTEDLHVRAVVSAMSLEPVIVDAATVLEEPVTITSGGIEIGRVKAVPGPGWLRRLAPDGWLENLDAPGVEGVVRAAAVSALAAIARDDRFKWLTILDHLGGAENKPYQYRLVAAAGVPVPEWIVTTDPDAVPDTGHWIAKALGPGSFIDGEGNGRIVPTRVVDVSDRDTVARVPFILQRMIHARAHARVVTVGDQAFSATLPATDLPLDWRMSPAGHFGFTPRPVPERIHLLAVAAATQARLGYSAQDWIEDTDGDWWFVDLNPAGQWLFLPNEVAAPVTEAIARHLDGRR
ncbi:hypothetical protein [Pimelobacter simplex]|uniref:hypothetical protein n=1 Tax=Nocardioides simplex TaxID=2045 RepID=UPI003AAB2103